jgi:DNA repair exonuclease SbcCD ATPase subunit
VRRLIVTDTHLGLYSDSDLWLGIVLDFFRYIVKYCIQNDIKEICHLGDFFDNRRSLNTKTQHIAHRIANILGAKKDLMTRIIIGNHDCYYKNQIHPSTLELFKEYKHIQVIDAETLIDDILLVPWGVVPDSTQGAKYCFGHFGINGFHMNDSMKYRGGLDAALFKDFDLVLSGHFHTPSKQSNVVYVGAPYGQTFHDVDGMRGFHIFEDGELTFEQYTEAPTFKKILTNDEPLNPDDIKGNIVRIFFTKDFGTTANQEIIDNVLKCEPLLYSVNFANMDSENEEEIDTSIEMDSKEQIVDQFIDEQTFATNINILTLKAMFKKLLRQAGDSKTIRATTGTKIECIEIGFQNFLSFGSRWQDVPLLDGVNFVTGLDKDKDKSNGAGKSSFLEAIPFALFGKTARDINQHQIINWKNKKNCQVVFRFKINEDLYEIKRTLKPNKLEIYKDGELMDQDAHKKDYQSMFEEIFGMDVKMFMSLVHSNVNNSASILSMNKAEKRKFLERMFGLEIYSDMIQLTNEKLRSIEEKKYKIDSDTKSLKDKIETANNMKLKFANEIRGKKAGIEDVNEIKEKLDRIKEDNPNIDTDIQQTESTIEDERNKIADVRREHEKELAVLETKRDAITDKLNDINLFAEQRKKNERLNVERKKIIDKVGDFRAIQEKIKESEGHIEANDKDLSDLRKEALELQKVLTELETNLKNIDKNLDLLAEGKCPVCGQDVTDPKDHYKKERTVFKRKITTQTKRISENEGSVKNITEDTDVLKKRIGILRQSANKLVDLESQIKDVGTEEEKTELVKEKELISKRILDKKEMFTKQSDQFIALYNAANNKLKDLKIAQGNIIEAQRKYDMAVSKAEEIKNSIESLQKMSKEQDEIMDKAKKEVESAIQGISKMNDITDYLNAIKFILKDENIKQYTIKQIMPFLNKQTNHYLSEVNYGFYVSIDKWLDVVIKGPGIRNASYDSLSGGERRGIDIALQLSLLDIARTQAGIFPDILVFDELLDSSIDSKGINSLMGIVKFKQREFGGKFFIISHRDEIDNEYVDNQYRVVKENGFSTVCI